MIKAENLCKSFGGITAVDALSFDVAAGEVYGLLGPNGAGKTTSLRILASLIKPDQGSATIKGLDSQTQAEAVRANIGVVNGGMGLYKRLTGLEILHYFGKLYGMSKAAIRERIQELDSSLDLHESLHKRSSDFSTGMQQKIVIARAILHNPEVILFDEATSGLDIMARRAVLDFVKSYPSNGRAVIYSTHVMSEVEELCDRVGIIFKGQMIAEGAVADLISQYQAKNLEAAFFAAVRNHQDKKVSS